MYLIGDVSQQERQHVGGCVECQTRIASLMTSLASFRTAVRGWSDGAVAKDHAARMNWTVIPASDNLERMLLPALETPWYRSLWTNVKDAFTPERPMPDITSKPVLVQNIWGQYGRQKKSWVMSLAFQTAAVLLLFTVAAATKVAPTEVLRMIALTEPVLAPYEPKMPARAETAQGGGGGGDRSQLPPSKGRLPKADLKQFTPPVAVINTPNPRLAMEPSIIAPPDVQLPNVNLSQYGDPLARLGPPSNGPGSGGGIGTGKGGGVGPGDGAGFGQGFGGGVGEGVYRIGGGVSSPALLTKIEPEYSEEARKAKYQGTVLLYIEVDPQGRATNIRVARSLGLGLDEKAIEAVKHWKFKPGYKDGKPVTVAATVEVNFRLL